MTARRRLARLALALAALGATWLSQDARVGADEVARDALSRLQRRSASAAERLTAAAAALGQPTLADPFATLAAAPNMAPHDDGVALALAVRALEEADIGSTAIAAALAAWPDVEDANGDAARAARATARWMLGERTVDPARITAIWPPSAAVAAALVSELGSRPAVPADLSATTAEAMADLLRREAVALAALDDAAADEVARMVRGLDRLSGEIAPAAAELLIALVARANDLPGPSGRTARAACAALALGRSRDVRALDELVRALDGDDGWLSTVAASALGDLGDPGAAPALAWHVAKIDDPFRSRDSWDFPGAASTDIPEADWATIEYFAIDAAACEALLRLGIRGGAQHLIERQLDPRATRYRIRVLQDAIDALRLHCPSAPTAAFLPDGGLPQRRAAFDALVAWWMRHRNDPTLLETRFDETSPSFRHAARRLVQKLRENNARLFNITKAAIALVGPPMTPTLLDAAERAARPIARSEIADALGMVGDPRAVEGLLALASDSRPVVRSHAARALGAYARHSPAACDRLLELLTDTHADVRAGAVEALVAAPRDARVRDALVAISPDDQALARSLTVARLVQEGAEAHGGAIEAGLASPNRSERVAWWGLLRRALDLAPSRHDATTDPREPAFRRIDRAAIVEALRTLGGGAAQ